MSIPTLPAPTLIIGYGNPSRGDDALGPVLLDEIACLLPQHPEWGAIELLTDFQLQIEFVLDLAGRQRIVFVDAAASGAEPFAFTPLTASDVSTAATHALTPGALLATFQRHYCCAPPPSFLLAIRGHDFELGAPLSDAARHNLQAARDMLCHWLAQTSPTCNQVAYA